ncbi:formation of crista junctions protein 1 [Elysia marginata]|uniref:Formation of crista junctions protein 1 n=1 Tax=Elysia marginata TaxID=1093978 RepID=A0AAV4GPC8_9GAST|nr:formation of crista junctions protein 1 [Elysia marginata]
MSRTVFVEELKAHNISIFVPRKDQCDLCTTYKQGNADEAAYTHHIERKEAAQKEKTTDKVANPPQSRTKVICVDVQRVLLSPTLKASALYYRTKLQICATTGEPLRKKNAQEYEAWLVKHKESGTCTKNYEESSGEMEKAGDDWNSADVLHEGSQDLQTHLWTKWQMRSGLPLTTQFLPMTPHNTTAVQRVWILGAGSRSS